MSRLTQWMDKTFYAEYGHQWDDAMFRERILAHLTPDARLLDLGAGRGMKPTMNFKGQCAFTAGVDPDEIVMTNPYLDEAKVLEAPHYAIPYPDESFDVVFSNCVIEHVVDVDAYFSEVRRVLVPGGLFLAKTPNLYHYVALLARVTPHWFHEFYNRLRGRQQSDTFPTTYACNRKGDVYRLAGAAGLHVKGISVVEGRPEYLRLNALTYLCGIAYERTVNAFPFLESIRCVIVFELEKPMAEDPSQASTERHVPSSRQS